MKGREKSSVAQTPAFGVCGSSFGAARTADRKIGGLRYLLEALWAASPRYGWVGAMKRLLQFALMALLAERAALAIVPQIVSNQQGGTDNAYYYKKTTGLGIASPTFYIYPRYLPGQMFLGGANNCGVLAFGLNSAYTPSVSDSGSESWQLAAEITGNYRTFYLYYVLGTAANITSITVTTTGTPTTPSSYPMTFFSPWVTEIRNCNPSAIGGTGTLDTAATGSAITLTLSATPALGDIVLGYFLDTSWSTVPGYGYPVPFDASISPGSGFTALSDSLSMGKIAEYSTSTQSTSVPVVYSGTNTILGVALVIKQGSAGTPLLSTMYVDHYQVDQSTGNNEILFPSSGSLLISTMTGIGQYITSISGSTGTWATSSSCYAVRSGQGTAQIAYAWGATGSPTANYTPTFSSTPTGVIFETISVTNANPTSAAFDKCATASGDQTTAANLSGVSFTPAQLNELIINATGIEEHTETGLVADANGHTPSPLFSTDSLADDQGSTVCYGTPASTLDEDDGWGWFVNPSDTLPVTFIYQGTQTTGSCTGYPVGVGYWQAVTIGFRGLGPAFIQANGIDGVAGSTGLAFSANVTNGDAIYAGLFDGGASSQTIAFSDTMGNTWNVVTASGMASSGYTVNAATDGDTLALGCAVVSAATGGDTVKFTVGGSGTPTGVLLIYEVSGATCTLDTTTSPSGGFTTSDASFTNPITSGSITTTTNNDLMLMFVGNVHNRGGSSPLAMSVSSPFVSLACEPYNTPTNPGFTCTPPTGDNDGGVMLGLAMQLLGAAGSSSGSITATNPGAAMEYGVVYAAFQPTASLYLQAPTGVYGVAH